MIITESPLSVAIGIIVCIGLLMMGCTCAYMWPRWLDAWMMRRDAEDVDEYHDWEDMDA